jgi:hypothetical protein
MCRLLYIILLCICNQQSRLCMKDIWIRCVRDPKNVHELYVKDTCIHWTIWYYLKSPGSSTYFLNACSSIIKKGNIQRKIQDPPLYFYFAPLKEDSNKKWRGSGRWKWLGISLGSLFLWVRDVNGWVLVWDRCFCGSERWQWLGTP